MTSMITGSLVALVTPMHDDGSLDLDAYRALIDWHIAENTQGLVVVGTTGESPTVTIEEHLKLIEVAVSHAKGRIPVIAGTGANSTQEAIELTHEAARLGAQAGLSVTPYYNKPSQEGLYQHYRHIAEACDLPLILYNVPGRTGVDLRNNTTFKLAQIPNIIGIKDATGNLERGTELILKSPSDFALYSGDDASALAFMLLGGHGVISVTANAMPNTMQAMCEAAFSGNLSTARALNGKLFALHKDLFVEANPIPIKWVMQQLGRIKKGIRLPLTALAQEHHHTLETALKQACM